MEIDGVNEKTPLLAFFVRDGKRVDTESGLPRDDLWIIRPSQNEVSGEGARCVERAVEMDAGWAGYTSERWDLSGCPSDGMLSLGSLRLSLRIEGDPRPFLVTRPLPLVEQSGMPVFGLWPNLRIPRARSSETLDAWTLKWKSDTESGAVDLSAVPIEESPRWWTIDTEWLAFPPHEPVTLRLRGPLGRGATVRLSVWNGLSIEAKERIYITDAPADLSVSLPEGVAVRRVEEGAWNEADARLSVQGREASVHLSDGRAAHVVTVQVPRLAAHLYDGAVEAPSSALAQPGALRIEDDWLRAASLPVVAFFSGDALASVESLRAEFPDETVVDCDMAQRGRAFGLGEIARARAASNSTQARILAKLDHDWIRVGTWHREMGLDDLDVVAIEDPSGCKLLFSWSSGRLIGDVQAVLWPQWTPWDPSQHMPVEPMGEHAAQTEAAQVDPGVYAAQLVSVDPWSPTPTKRPALDDPAIGTVEVGSVASRMLRIQEAEGMRGSVMRVLAAGSASERSIRWNRACAEATIEDLPLLLDVAGLEAGDDVWQRLERASKDRRFERTEAIAETDWAAAVGTLDATSPEVRAAYLTVLGALDAPAGEWASAWEPAAWCGTATTSPDLERWADRLGLGEANETTSAAESPGDEAGELDQMLMWTDLSARRGDFGDAPHEQMSAMPPRQLMDISRALGLIPGGALGKDAQSLGYMKWLSDRSDRQESSQALGEAIHELVQSIGTARSVDPVRFGPASQAVRGRMHSRARAGEAEAWLNAPFAVGALAFLLRAQAVSSKVRSELGFNRAWLRLTALHALQAAPDLFAHDLCWMHLELSAPNVNT